MQKLLVGGVMAAMIFGGIADSDAPAPAVSPSVQEKQNMAQTQVIMNLLEDTTDPRAQAALIEPTP